MALSLGKGQSSAGSTSSVCTLGSFILYFWPSTRTHVFFRNWLRDYSQVRRASVGAYSHRLTCTLQAVDVAGLQKLPIQVCLTRNVTICHRTVPTDHYEPCHGPRLLGKFIRDDVLCRIDLMNTGQRIRHARVRSDPRTPRCLSPRAFSSPSAYEGALM